METLTGRYQKPHSSRPASRRRLGFQLFLHVTLVSAGLGPQWVQCLCSRGSAALWGSGDRSQRRPPARAFLSGRTRVVQNQADFFLEFCLEKMCHDAVTRCFDIAESAALIFQFEIFINIYISILFFVSVPTFPLSRSRKPPREFQQPHFPGDDAKTPIPRESRGAAPLPSCPRAPGTRGGHSPFPRAPSPFVINKELPISSNANVLLPKATILLPSS